MTAVAGLFAGIGGFEQGFAEAGHRPSMTCEVWPPARAVLRARFAKTIDCPDIRELTGLPDDVRGVCAGFPCQDLSQAGRTAGIDGTRSALVSHVFRLIDTSPPDWVVLENVPFMLHLDRGRALHTIVEAIESRGMRWAYRVVDTLAFLPQRRERVFLVAGRELDPAGVLLADEVHPPPSETRLDRQAHGFYWTEGTRGLGWAADAIPTLKTGSAIGIPSPPAILMPDGAVVCPDIRDAERLQGFPPGWTEPAETAGRASHRWALIGNAVSVPVAAWLGARLASPGDYDRARDRPLPPDGRWPRAAHFDGNERRGVAIGSFPAWTQRPPLHRFLRYPGQPLSARATEGFLRRADASRLRFPEGFTDRLRAHLGRMRDRAAEAAACPATS